MTEDGDGGIVPQLLRDQLRIQQPSDVALTKPDKQAPHSDRGKPSARRGPNLTFNLTSGTPPPLSFKRTPDKVLEQTEFAERYQNSTGKLSEIAGVVRPLEPRQSLWRRLAAMGKALVGVPAVLVGGPAVGAMLPPVPANVQVVSWNTQHAAEHHQTDSAFRSAAGDTRAPPEPPPNPVYVTVTGPSFSEKVVDALLIAAMVKATLDAGNLIKLGTEFWDKFKRTPDETELDDLAKEAKTKTEESMAGGEIKFNLSSEVVGVLEGQMTSAMEGIIATYKDPGMSDYDKGQQAQRIRRNYCFFMNEMKKFNGGKLPEKIESQWTNNMCSSYAF